MVFKSVIIISRVGPLEGSLRRWISSIITVLTLLIQETRWRRSESSFSVVRMRRSYFARYDDSESIFPMERITL